MFWANGAKWYRLGAVPLPEAGDMPRCDLLALREAMQAEQPQSGASAEVRVAIADAWLVAAEIPWAEVLLTESADSYVSAHLEMLGVESSAMQVALDDAPASAPRLAMAAPRELLEGIEAIATGNGRRLLSVSPLSALVWEAVHARIGKPHYVLAVAEAGALTMLAIDGGRVRAVHSHRLSREWNQELPLVWRRVQLRDASLAAVSQIYAVALDQEVASSPLDGVELLHSGSFESLCSSVRPRSALTFKLRAPSVRPWQWAAAVLCATLLGAAAWQATRAQGDYVATQDALAQLQQPLAPARANLLGNVDPKEFTAVKREISTLDVPIDLLLSAVLPPAATHTSLLSFEMSAPRDASEVATVRVTGEARDTDDLTGYVTHLSETPPFVDAHLTRHESGARGYRFTVEAAWQR